ncbi:MAG: DUF2520 domain-containing protein [Porphyromonadaceae bacterium]|nr:MAG: DUF2520 domain-containing protein [Porphyromonadaceae bacterium]
MSYRIGFIGAGRVAWHLAPALKKSGHRILQVISKSALSAQKLGDRVGCEHTDKITKLDRDIQILFLTVADHALVELINDISDYRGIVVHTSGTFSSMRFACQKYKYGGMYPLQTFSTGRPLDLSKVPVFIEGCEPAVTEVLVNLASGFSSEVHVVGYEERRWMHLAAVWSNNFTNHMLTNAYGIMNEHSLPVQWLEPLIRETFNKAIELGPLKSQTGPAVRHDQQTLEKHVDLLSYSQELQVLYKRISDSIQNVSTASKGDRL